MSTRHLFVAALVGLAALVGCSGSGSSAAPATEPMAVAIPADSPFAKIKNGMQTDEVFATIGQPTNQAAYSTGKAYIPFHYGGDNTRMIARYKGVGTLIFSQNSAFTSAMTLIEIHYDPTEPGYERNP